MIFNFIILKTIESTPQTLETLLPDQQHLQLNLREALTVFDFMSYIDLLDHELKKPYWNPWKFDFGTPRANKLAEHVVNGSLISPPPTAQELEMTHHLLEQDALVSSIESPLPGKVPGFKFTTDEFWCVTPRECRIISLRLRSMEQSGELRKQIGKFTIGVSCFDYYCNCELHHHLILQWATFNEIAAMHEGYFVE